MKKSNSHTYVGGRITHGHTIGGRPTPEFYTWNAMRSRCRNPNCRGYARYGGRGIRVCRRWDSSFVNFLEDMGLRPGSGYSIERLDGDGDYCCGRPDCKDCRANGVTKSNCVWGTVRQQANNRSTNRRITVGGKTRTLADWADRSGLNRHTLRCRLNWGWSPADAVSTPANATVCRWRWRGRLWTVRGLARAAGVSYWMLAARLGGGMSVEDAVTKPARQYHRLRWRGRDYTLSGLARAVGLRAATLGARLRLGWTLRQALTRRVDTRRSGRPARPGTAA